MKRLISTTLFCLLTISAFAQKVTEGDVWPVFSEQYLNVTFDFSKTVIDGVPESTLLNIGGERAKDWSRDKSELCSKFMLAMYEEIKELVEVGNHPEAAFTLSFIPTAFDDDGDVHGSATITDKKGNIVAIISGVDGDAGRWGAFTNLCGDAMISAGRSLGSCLWFEYNKVIKQQKREANKAVRQRNK